MPHHNLDQEYLYVRHSLGAPSCRSLGAASASSATSAPAPDISVAVSAPASLADPPPPETSEQGRAPRPAPGVAPSVALTAASAPSSAPTSPTHHPIPPLPSLPSLTRYLFPRLWVDDPALLAHDLVTDELAPAPINHTPTRPLAWFRAAGLVVLSLPGVVAWLAVVGGANNASPLSAAIVIVFALHQLTLIALGITLVEVTNESTVSGMVAQRYNKTAYLTIVSLVSYAWFTSSYILAGGAARGAAPGGIGGTSSETWRVLIAATSPIVTLGVFIFPIVVVKDAAELSMLPLDALAFVRAPDAQEPHRARASAFQRSAHFRMAFWHGMSRRWHAIAHYTCFTVGAGSGLATVGWHLIAFWGTLTDAERGVEIFLLATSTVALFVFAVLDSIPAIIASHTGRRRVFLFEYLGLHYFMCALVFSNVMAERLVGVADVGPGG